MDTNQENIKQLLAKLEMLLKKQADFSREINSLQIEVARLKSREEKQPAEKKEDKPAAEAAKTQQTFGKQLTRQQPVSKRPVQPAPKTSKQPTIKADLEKFIGENLISKIGIAITVIGVAIGAKYAIDHKLISPLTRILLGYLTGLGLLGFAIRLKKNYENFSAVLLSGSMAIMYFITYAAYSFYDLMPQVLAFGLMVLITAFAVVAALRYNKQIIAHFGLVGAYAVPFLLSDGSGDVAVLFSYTAIINVGILVIAFRKYWKPIYYSAFIFTWLIYFSWYVTDYYSSKHFGLALAFLSIFFVIFYLIFLGYKLLQKEKFNPSDVLLLLSNSFIFYGLGYGILDSHETGTKLLGLFTLCNAAIHLIVSAVIYRQKLADRNLLYLVSGLVLLYITLSIPVQLDGNWVTLLWAGEAALLFWIGRTRNAPLYEKLAYPLIYLAFFSIMHDWSTLYGQYSPHSPETRIPPLLNINFLSGLLVLTAFGFINMLSANKQYPSALNTKKEFSKIITYSVPVIFLLTLYFVFRVEIANYWDQLYSDSYLAVGNDDQNWNQDLKKLKIIWIINYSLLFVSLLAFANIKKLKNQLLGYVNIGLLLLAVLTFLSTGLFVLSELRESYLEQAGYDQQNAMHIGVRYISIAFLVLSLYAGYTYTRQHFLKAKLKMAFDFLLHMAILWVASSELLHWMDMYDLTQSDKLGLSILWGVYSLFLIVLGIWKAKKYLRIGAIGLFGITLVKLALYDIAHLDTISQTVVFVSLGVLLLIISFLYNKYKHIISGEDEKQALP